jgi:hypothetical protein
MFATKPLAAPTWLEAAGVALAADGTVIVDRYSRSSVVHPYCRRPDQPPQPAPVATAEAMWLAKTLTGSEPAAVDHEGAHGDLRQPEWPRSACRKSAREVGAVDV